MEKLFEMSKKEISRYHALKNLHTQHMSQKDTAELLGFSERHVRRLLKRYPTQGAEGLVSGHRGKKSNHALTGFRSFTYNTSLQHNKFYPF